MRHTVRKLTLLCRIVDNLGDAGVALRFARQWLQTHPADSVCICTDQTAPFHRLIGSHAHASIPGHATPLTDRMTILGSLDPADHFEWGDLIIEMFGTPVPAHWKQRLAARKPQPHWVNLEYLSAEPWIEDCHGLWSSDPATGWRQLFFFPGFTGKTGGLLGAEPAAQTRPASETEAKTQPPQGGGALRAFVFAYCLAPLQPWLIAGHANKVSFHIASASNDQTLPDAPACEVQTVDFVPQTEFDTLLKSFDLVFIRGEDSFVRAQLAGLPFVWQIYPTDDGAHWTKLDAFFSIYAEGLAEPARSALKKLWWYWNCNSSGNTSSNTGSIPDGVQAEDKQATDHLNANNILNAVLAEMPILQAHAQRWQEKIARHSNLIERLSQALDITISSDADASP